jgi:hypothetical protein
MNRVKRTQSREIARNLQVHIGANDILVMI